MDVMVNVQDSMTCMLCIYCILFLDNLCKIFDTNMRFCFDICVSGILVDVCCKQLTGCSNLWTVPLS